MDEMFRWRDIAEEQPPKEGCYLVYTLNGQYGVKRWAKLCYVKARSDREKKCILYPEFNPLTGMYDSVEPPFSGFIAPQSRYICNPVKNVMFWMPILAVPEEANDNIEKLRKLKAQELAIQNQIKALRAEMKGG